MIIEAGYDLHTLMFSETFPAKSVRVVSLDADFRVVSVSATGGLFTGDFSTLSIEAVDEVVPRHDEDDEFENRYAVRFVAIGFEVPSVEDYIERLDWDRHRAFTEWFDCRGIDFLGVYVSDPERWAASGPMRTFATYAGAEDYPRVLIVRGPHPFLTCTCAVCGPERERLDRARAAAIARETSV